MEKMRKDGGKGKEEEGCREGGRSGGREVRWEGEGEEANAAPTHPVLL